MAHMQLAGDVRWRDNDTKGFLALFYLCMKITVLLPKFIPFLLYRSRVVNLGDIMLFAHLLIPPYNTKALSITDRANIIVVPPIFPMQRTGHLMRVTCACVLAYYYFSKAAPGLHHFCHRTACTNRCFSKAFCKKGLPFLACQYFAILHILTRKIAACQEYFVATYYTSYGQGTSHLLTN